MSTKRPTQAEEQDAYYKMEAETALKMAKTSSEGDVLAAAKESLKQIPFPVKLDRIATKLGYPPDFLAIFCHILRSDEPEPVKLVSAVNVLVLCQDRHDYESKKAAAKKEEGDA